MRYDYLVVGAGLFGSVFAQQAHECSKRVLVIDRRPHVGGNCYSYEDDDTGIIVHAYGTHIFHCSDAGIWKYVNRFVEFNGYRHKVLASYRNRVVPMPINLATMNAILETNWRPRDVDMFLSQQRLSSALPSNLEEEAIGIIGRPLYEALVAGYTAKQWGFDPKALPTGIVTRLPVRSSYRDNYFDDLYQGIPMGGYATLFSKLLTGVDVELCVDFFDSKDYFEQIASRVVYTGPIDRYFNYCYGRLNWRSVYFEIERIDEADYQGIAVMNYPDKEVPYTRVHEPKHLHLELPWNRKSTLVMREYPCVDFDNPYYPVCLQVDQHIYRKYVTMQAQEPKVIFGGRLARYRYYDMHQVIAGALATARRELGT